MPLEIFMQQMFCRFAPDGVPLHSYIRNKMLIIAVATTVDSIFEIFLPDRQISQKNSKHKLKNTVDETCWDLFSIPSEKREKENSLLSGLDAFHE
jgi:hypothetical protein